MSPHDNPHSNTNDAMDIVQPSTLQASDAMCRHCFDTLIDHIQGKNNRGWKLFQRTNTPDFAQDLPDLTAECPLFITWDKTRPKRFPNNLLQQGGDTPLYELRGCIGTLSPKPVITSIGEYALTSALRDRRFQPVALPEIPHLRVAVSLLVNYEPCNHCLDWLVGTHGILIKFWSQAAAREYSATYLPEVAQEQGWDQRQAVTALVRKSGYPGPVDQALLDSIQCTRYQSSKKRMTFEEYVLYKQRASTGNTSVPSTQPSSASSSFNQQDLMSLSESDVPKKWNTCNNL